MSVFCHALNVSQLEQALSPARIASYRSLVGAGHSNAAIGAYVWGLELNSALAPLLSMVEIVLRNSVHLAATALFSKPDWYQDVLKKCGDDMWASKVASTPTLSSQYYRQAVPPHNRRNVWVSGVRRTLRHWRSPAEGKLEDVLDRLTAAGKPHIPDQVIAHTMFGFWIDVMDPSFESATNAFALWPSCLATVFPNDGTMTRARVHTILNRIRTLRNRVSHHEPAWKVALPLTPAGVNAALGSQVQEMRELLLAMNTDVVGLLETTGTLGRLAWLLDPRTISCFAGQTPPATIDHRSFQRKVRKIVDASRKNLAAAAPRPSRAVELQHAGRPLVTLLPHA